VTPDYFVELYDYNYWAHRRVWTCVEQLTDEQFNYPLDYSIDSIRIHCAHMMVVEQMWIHHLHTGRLLLQDEDDFLTCDAIAQRWEAVEQEVRSYVGQLTANELERETQHPLSSERRCKVWEGLMQTALHSLDHRSQVLAGLHKLGAPTVEQGFLHYVYEKRGYST
jgi:uncharacterized damage-inducible protein DinB